MPSPSNDQSLSRLLKLLGQNHIPSGAALVIVQGLLDTGRITWNELEEVCGALRARAADALPEPLRARIERDTLRTAAPLDLARVAAFGDRPARAELSRRVAELDQAFALLDDPGVCG